MKIFNFLFGKNKQTENNKTCKNSMPTPETKVKTEREYTFEEMEEVFERNAVIIRF